MIHISPTRLLILPALALCCLCQCTQSGARHTTRATATKAAAPDASPARNRTWKPNKAVLPLRKQAVEILLAIKDHNRRSGGLAGAVKLAVELERFTEAWKVYDETREHSHMSFGRRWMELQHAEALTRRGRLTRALGILSRGSTPSDRTHQSAAWANLARAAEARGKHSLAARALKQTDPDVVPVVGLAARIHKAGERDVGEEPERVLQVGQQARI